jgi:hypothetical protein
MMLKRTLIGSITLAAGLVFAASAFAFDDAQYPDFSGQWRKPPRLGNQWDPTKPLGRAQNPPLTAEYQKVFDASLADQAAGGQGEDVRITCAPPGMPRMMTAVRPFEFVIMPKITYVNFENQMPRRIYTDGRSFPTDEEPSFAGYSIGRWVDTNGDGKYDVLEVETRQFKGPRHYEASGIPLHHDNEGVLKERFFLDKDNKDILDVEITSTDHALTRPWTITKKFRREREKVLWYEDICNENNNHVAVGKDYYFLSAEGYIMPTRKGQEPPDLRYFPQAKK